MPRQTRRNRGAAAKVATHAMTKKLAKKAVAKTGAKVAVKAGGRFVPGVGEVIMVVDAAPVAAHELQAWGREVGSGLRETYEARGLGKKVKAGARTMWRSGSRAMAGSARTALAALLAREAAEATYRKRENPGTRHFLQRVEERGSGLSEKAEKKLAAVHEALTEQKADLTGLHGRYAVQFGGPPGEKGNYLVVEVENGIVTGIISLLVDQNVIMANTGIVQAKDLGIDLRAAVGPRLRTVKNPRARRGEAALANPNPDGPGIVVVTGGYLHGRLETFFPATPMFQVSTGVEYHGSGRRYTSEMTWSYTLASRDALNMILGGDRSQDATFFVVWPDGSQTEETDKWEWLEKEAKFDVQRYASGGIHREAHGSSSRFVIWNPRGQSRRNPLGKGAYPFAFKQEQYRQYTLEQLEFAVKDAYAAAQAMRGHSPESEAWYMDDVSTIRAEINRRRARTNTGFLHRPWDLLPVRKPDGSVHPPITDMSEGRVLVTRLQKIAPGSSKEPAVWEADFLLDGRPMHGFYQESGWLWWEGDGTPRPYWVPRVQSNPRKRLARGDRARRNTSPPTADDYLLYDRFAFRRRSLYPSDWPQWGYTVREIMKEMDWPERKVVSSLRRLYKAGKIAFAGDRSKVIECGVSSFSASHPWASGKAWPYPIDFDDPIYDGYDAVDDEEPVAPSPWKTPSLTEGVYFGPPASDLEYLASVASEIRRAEKREEGKRITSRRGRK